MIKYVRFCLLKSTQQKMIKYVRFCLLKSTQQKMIKYVRFCLLKSTENGKICQFLSSKEYTAENDKICQVLSSKEYRKWENMSFFSFEHITHFTTARAQNNKFNSFSHSVVQWKVGLDAGRVKCLISVMHLFTSHYISWSQLCHHWVNRGISPLHEKDTSSLQRTQ